MRPLFFILLVVVLIGVGSIVWQQKKPQSQSASPSVTPTRKPDLPSGGVQESPKEVTRKFYDAYLTCMKQPPAVAEGNVGEYCQNNTGYTTSGFADAIKAGGTAQAGADPILCSQNPPQHVSVINATAVENGMARSTVNETFGEREQKISVTLRVEKDALKVDMITCPKP